MTTVLSVQLERERPLVVYELGNTTICETQHEGWLAGGDEVQFLRSAFRPGEDGGFGCESAGDRSHELEEGGRHALLVPVSFGNARLRLAAEHCLVKVIFSLLVTVLLMLLLPAQPIASLPVSFVLLLLSKNQEVERSGKPPVRMSAIAASLTDSILADKTVVELNVASFLFDLSESCKVVEPSLASGTAGSWTKGGGIRSQMVQEASEGISLTRSPQWREPAYLLFSKFTSPCASSAGGVTTFGITITSKILSKSQPISTSSESPAEV